MSQRILENRITKGECTSKKIRHAALRRGGPGRQLTQLEDYFASQLNDAARTSGNNLAVRGVIRVVIDRCVD